MTGIVELAKVDAVDGATVEERDTWIFELPPELCEREGYSKGTLVSLTIRDGGVLTSILPPSGEIDAFVHKVVEEEREYFEEMKRIGD